MPRLTETLNQIIQAEREAAVLRSQYGAQAERTSQALLQKASAEQRARRRLVERALRSDGRGRSRPSPPRRGAIGLAALILAWAGASAALAAVSPKVERGIEACLPMLTGQTPDAVAPQLGLQREGRAWVLSGPGATVELAPPGLANPQVCALYISHEPDQAQAILDGVDAWASAPERAMARLRHQEASADGARLTSAWSGTTAGQELDIVLSKDAAPSEGDRESMIVITAR